LGEAFAIRTACTDTLFLNRFRDLSHSGFSDCQTTAKFRGHRGTYHDNSRSNFIRICSGIYCTLNWNCGTPIAAILVLDNGPRFQRELIGAVFDPYVTSKLKGTGLVLAIVKKIVEEHGGPIDADYRRSGGARVRIALPLGGNERLSTAREPRKLERRSGGAYERF
jgi:hypothetical protein